MEQDEQNQVHRLLQESIACYRKLMEVYDRLREKLSSGGASETLQALIDQSRELYTVVQFVDSQFQQLANEKQVPLEEVPLFFEWKTLLENVREENKLISRQLKAGMAVLKSDMDQLGRSKAAIGKYHNRKGCRGERINVFSA